MMTDPAMLWFFRHLDGLAAKGMTLVLSTHDVDLAYAWADDIAILFEGTTLLQGQAPDVLGDGQALSRARLRPPLLLELARALDWPEPWPRTREALLGRQAGA